MTGGADRQPATQPRGALPRAHHEWIATYGEELSAAGRDGAFLASLTVHPPSRAPGDS